jgi:hypothetical protein
MQLQIFIPSTKVGCARYKKDMLRAGVFKSIGPWDHFSFQTFQGTGIKLGIPFNGFW